MNIIVCSKKKGWSPFGSKQDSKGLAAGISNFFSSKKGGAAGSPSSPESSKRQAPVPAPRSPDVIRRGASRMSDRTTTDRALTPDHMDKSPSMNEPPTKLHGKDT